MYGYYGAGYDLGDYEGDDMGELDGVMDVLKKDVMGVPVWALGLAGLAALVYTKPGKRMLSMVGIGKASKKNPRRRKMKANRRHRRNRRSRR
jgi:hypothetical protein